MAYGDPAVLAVAAEPGLDKLTLPMVSPFSRSDDVNSVPVKVMVWPKVLLTSLAVMVSALAVMSERSLVIAV